VAGTVELRTLGRVALVLLDRPEALNAFDLDMADQLARRLAALAADDRVHAVVLGGDGRALDEATRLAGELAGRSVHAFAMAKRLLNGSFETALEEQLERERHGMVAAAAHPDGQEGLRAFVDKRPPSFPPA